MSHRVAYEYLVGVIPEGMVIDHLCRQTSCVNPDHLEPVTQKINLSRAYRNPEKFGLAQKRKTHCKRNHPYDEENTYRHGGRRHCRQCRKDAKTNV